MPDTEMPYRSLGRCGTRVSMFGLGGWTTFGESLQDEAVARAMHRTAFDAGINFFDIADIYAKGEAERLMGRVLADFPRHELVISSKVFFPMSDRANDRGLSRKHIMESVEKSLKRIGTDYLDIYFCHRFDRETPLEETVRALDDLIRQGKVLYWGTSTWRGDQLRAARFLCDARNLHRPQVEQPQYSLLARTRFERDVRPAVEELGMGTVTWSPLAFGLLTGKYDDGVPPDSRLGRLDWLREGEYSDDRVAAVRKFKSCADELGCTRAQLALAWVATQPAVSSVILGASRLEQLEENLGAVRVQIPDHLAATLDDLFPHAEPRRLG